jgi:hypothetical protein
LLPLLLGQAEEKWKNHREVDCFFETAESSDRNRIWRAPGRRLAKHIHCRGRNVLQREALDAWNLPTHRGDHRIIDRSVGVICLMPGWSSDRRGQKWRDMAQTPFA